MQKLFFSMTFLCGLLLTLFSPFFFPGISLHFFAPILLFTLLKKKRGQALFFAFLSGLFLDLLSAQTSMGFWALNFVLTLLILSLIQHLFFSEKIITLPLLSIFFSELSTLLYFLISTIFCTKTHFTLKWVLTDLVLFPILDGALALFLFSLPLYILSKCLPTTTRQTTSLNLQES